MNQMVSSGQTCAQQSRIIASRGVSSAQTSARAFASRSMREPKDGLLALVKAWPLEAISDKSLGTAARLVGEMAAGVSKLAMMAIRGHVAGTTLGRLFIVFVWLARLALV